MYKTYCTEAESHTAEYIAAQIKAVINEIGAHKVLGIVTDNASSMVKARRLVQEEYSAIAEYGCIAHALNLIIGDIMKCASLKNFEAQCKEIIKEITGSHATLAAFNKIQREKNGSAYALRLPVVTRWGSILHSLNSLIKTKFSLKVLVVSKEVGHKISASVKKNILDDDIFWVKVEKLAEVLIPIVKWITKLEGDDLKMPEVVEAFQELDTSLQFGVPLLPISKKEETTILQTYAERKAKALKPVHFAANLLHPQKAGKELSQDDHLSAMEFITTMVSLKANSPETEKQTLKELYEYVAHTNVFSSQYMWKNVNAVDPVTWWGGLCSKTKLKATAIGILTLPPSSAATERSFSTYGFIHTAKRNRLTIKRAGMLTYISHNIKLCNSITITNNNKRRKIGESTSKTNCDGTVVETEKIQDSGNSRMLRLFKILIIYTYLFHFFIDSDLEEIENENWDDVQGLDLEEWDEDGRKYVQYSYSKNSEEEN